MKHLLIIIAAGITIHVTPAQRAKLAAVKSPQVQAALQQREVRNNDTADILVRLLKRP